MPRPNARPSIEDRVTGALRRLPPRAMGGVMLLTGAGLSCLNLWMILGLGEFFLVSLLLGPPLILVGLWRVVLGRPLDAHTAQPVRWDPVGVGACVIIGLIIAGVSFVSLSVAGHALQLDL